jgi:hypothetical protein
MEGKKNWGNVKALEERYPMLPATWWYAAAAAGKVPSRKIGKYVVFDLDEIAQWVEQQRREPQST